ncbi:glycine zipper family protein [Yoonia sp. SS1-5]|uniref:Glycine zipper family protein n=1 Tax=Yoonia rhodophyticola TaxID=3137370 RepID=A0AAN0MKQ6_9RHOB
MKLFYILALCPLIAIAGCADSGAAYTPILDGPPQPSFQSDLQACQGLARNQSQFDQETAAAAVLGGGVGALLGRFDDDTTVAEGLVGGVLAGGVAAAVDANDRREAIVMACLKGRGHRVVG